MYFFGRRYQMKIILLIGLLFLIWGKEADASNGTKIHFISWNGDAILLESNGHYGMVDSGEDWDYPDGEEYPLREGVTVGIGFEQQVIHYLKQLGVEKLDFYIATHAHSDHIGSGDEILNYFPTERLYISEYSDEYLFDAHMTDPSDPYYIENYEGGHLWDNQYVYDRLINAAKENGTQIITNLDYPENEQYRSFEMGDMKIEIMNFERERDAEGNIMPVYDDNCNSLVTKVTAFDKVALLTADMDPWVREAEGCGDTAKVAQQLIEQLWVEEDAVDQELQVADNYEEEIYENPDGVVYSMPEEVWEEHRSNKAIIDESKANTDKTISLDLLKLAHHGLDYNNTTYFLTSLNPKNVVITGLESQYNARKKDCMPNAKVFATATDSAAVVAEFTSEAILTDYIKITPGWMELDERNYYFDENGRTYTDSGNHVIDGVEYCFDEKGAVDIENRWVLSNGVWKYWKEGKFACDEWIELSGFIYYCDAQGKMLTGWQWIDGKCYYFNSNGELIKDEWIGGHYVDSNGIWIEKYSTAKWFISQGRWWYCRGDGGYPAAKWEIIDGTRYYFDRNGWMATGWQVIDGKWYYFDAGGKMLTDTWIGDYYVDATGVWVQEIIESKWIASGGRWWYRHGDGSYTSSGWEYIDGLWYYFDASGWMQTGWVQVGGAWYYLGMNGAMASNTWIGDYHVNESGVWDTTRRHPQWILSGNRWWYQHSDGGYTVSDWEYIDNQWYYFDASGWMQTGWQYVNGKWYYLETNGVMAVNKWVGNYYVKYDGSMAVDEWVENGSYYVDESGLWIPKER